MHSENSVVTLTYATDPVTLRREDVAIFIKSLRNAGFRFRYFGCGEYGEKLSRPHYHLILFGLDFEDKTFWRKKDDRLYFRSKTLEKHWHHGHSEIGLMNPKAALYIASYVQKKINGPDRTEHYQREYHGCKFDVSPEMTLCSTMPGIGHDWIKKHWRDVYPNDFIVIDGKERQVPAYYDKWLRKHQPGTWELVQANRQDYAENAPLETELRMEQAALARDAKAKNLSRDLEKIRYTEISDHSDT